ncbi:hypothetical protein RYX36_035105 [Vicia faba]
MPKYFTIFSYDDLVERLRYITVKDGVGSVSLVILKLYEEETHPTNGSEAEPHPSGNDAVSSNIFAWNSGVKPTTEVENRIFFLEQGEGLEAHRGVFHL